MRLFKRSEHTGGALLSVVVLLLLAIMLAGCATGEVQTVVVNELVEAEGAPVMPQATQAAGGGGQRMQNSADVQTVDFSAPQDQSAQIEPLIIKNGSLVLIVPDIEAGAGEVTSIADFYGGYVLSSEFTAQGAREVATLVITVNSDDFEEAMAELRGLAERVVREAATGEDVTGEYVDLQSRLRNLEQTRDRLREFLDEAQNVEEALNVNRELSNIEGQIEQVIGRMEVLSNLAALSRITVELRTEPAPSELPEWSLGRIVNNAATTQVDVFRGLVSAAIWLIIVPGPYLLILALVFFAGRAILRRMQSRGAPSRVTTYPDEDD